MTAAGFGTISNDDSATFSIVDVTLDEGDLGNTVFNFAVTLSVAVDSGVDVDFATSDDSALTADNDYAENCGTLNFAGNGGEQQIISVNIGGDNKVEPDERFFVDLSGVAAGGRDVSLAGSQGIGNIDNDDTTTADFKERVQRRLMSR